MIQKYILSLLLLVGFLTPMNSNAQIGIECKGCDMSKLPPQRAAVIYDSLALTIRINGSGGGYVDLNSLPFWNMLKVFIRTGNKIDSASTRVIAYNSIITGSRGAKSFSNLGPDVKEEIKEAIKLGKKDDLILFHDIRIIDINGVEKTIDIGPVFRVGE